MAEDIAMNDMDMDIDFEIDPEIARLQAEADAINARAEAADTEAMNGVEEAPEEGEIDSTSPAPTKVHVRGVDSLNTYQIEDWAAEHYSRDLFKKVQWVDDTSANLIYDTELAAAEALIALSAEDVEEPLQLRPAKRLSTHPDLELHVRQAIVADIKAPRAKDRSKFYLFNKEWDPDNPENVRPDNRKRRWVEDDRGDRKYRRRDYVPRNDPREESNFHESMYDDDPKPVQAPRRDSYHSDRDRGYGRRRRPNLDEDIMAPRDSGRLRDRSASPSREGDGRFGFDEVQPHRRTARARSRTPPGIRAGKDNHRARDNLRQELFPEKRAATALNDGRVNGGVTSPQISFTPSSNSASRELFPDKVNGAVHRRQSAKALTPGEVADAIGKYTIHDKARDAFTYSRSGRRADNGNGGGGGEQSRDLFSRINGGPQVESSFGRLHDQPKSEKRKEAQVEEDVGFSFKGAGRLQNAQEDQGFSFRGASQQRVENPLVKELFPLKASAAAAAAGNGAKELFDGRIKGRGAQRRRAEDMF